MGRWFKRNKKSKQVTGEDGTDYVLSKDDEPSFPVAAVNDDSKREKTSLNNNNSNQVKQGGANEPSSNTQIADDNGEQVDQTECLWEPDLHWKHKVIGSCACAFFGTLVSSNSFRQMAAYASNTQAASVIQAALGNLLVVCSSFFWSSPKKQLQQMWRETSRRLSSIVYGSSIVTTVTVAIMQPPLVSLYYFILMVIQYVSVVVYALTYVPCCKTRMNNFFERKLTHSGHNKSNNMADADAEQPTVEGVMA